MKKTNTDNSSKWVMLIAILALSTSLYESYEFRKHNRLSLRPYLDQTVYVQGQEYYKLSVQNEGLGPAIIEEFTILANTKIVSNWNSALAEIGVHKFSALSTLKKGNIISAGESITLVKIDTLLSKYNLKFIIKYSSVYEERFNLEKEF